MDIRFAARGRVAVTPRGLAVAVALTATAAGSAARAQSLTAEAAVTAGASTESVGAASVQIRGFGDVPGAVRFFAEGTWADRSGTASDVFGAAYPYSGRLQVMESYAERTFRRGSFMTTARGGRFRTPFGISNGSDHSYTGFLRSPLIRYDGYFALSNNYLEHGVDVTAGFPQLTFEAGIGRPADVGDAVRRPGTDVVVRAQGFYGPLVVGVSHIDTQPYLPDTFAFGKNVFTGFDVRWMQRGVQIRGEWLRGRPFDGTSTVGWYADAIVHLRAMGPVTAVGRIERLDYDTIPQFALHARRQTVGVRIRFFNALSAQVNVIHQDGALPQKRPTALDVGVTYSLRRTLTRN